MMRAVTAVRRTRPGFGRFPYTAMTSSPAEIIASAKQQGP